MVILGASWLVIIGIGAVLGGATIADLVALRNGKRELRHSGDAVPRFPSLATFPRVAVQMGRPVLPTWRSHAAIVVRRGSIVVLLVTVLQAGLVLRDVLRIDRYQLALTKPQIGEPYNVLLVGTDARTASEIRDIQREGGDVPYGRRTDTIIVLHLDPKTGEIRLLSIPRDLVVALPDGRRGRINAAYGVSRQTLVDAVQSLDIPLARYIEIDFGGLRSLVDEAGGIALQSSAPARDDWTGLVLSGACQKLDGNEALAVARSRRAEYFNTDGWLPDRANDRGRVQRQQVLLVELARALRGINLWNPLTVKHLAHTAGEHLGIDRSMSINVLRSLASHFSPRQGEFIVHYRHLPSSNAGTTAASRPADDSTSSTSSGPVPVRSTTEPEPSPADNATPLRGASSSNVEPPARLVLRSSLRVIAGRFGDVSRRSFPSRWGSGPHFVGVGVSLYRQRVMACPVWVGYR